MKHSSEVRSKLDMDDERVTIPVQEIVSLVSDIFENMGCSVGIAHEVAAHLADANLCGMESHGLMRTLQYADQFESGYMRADVEPEVKFTERCATIVDGNGGIGIPAMRLASIRVMHWHWLRR
jgi:LDH2 family malate/lactate/ureidoglycolate dehydrogenase